MFNRITSLGVALGRQLTLQNLQGELATLTSEMSSGKKADPSKELGVGVSVLYKLYTDVQQGDAIRSVGTMAGQRLETMQTALSSTGKLLGSMATVGLQAVNISASGSQAIVATQARDTMASLVTLLNTQVDGEAVFAGTDSGKAPMLPSSVGLAGSRAVLDASNAGLPLDETDVPALLTGMNDLFNVTVGDPSAPSYENLFYASRSKTGGVPSQIRIGAGETLNYDVRGDNPGFKDAFQALSLMSLLDAKNAAGVDMLDEDAKALVLEKANSLLGKAQSLLTTVAGELGVKQQRLESVSDIQDKAVSAATAQINTLEGVDYYTASDRISSLEIQLKATYSITAKLSDLSLVNYLR